jgi:hypothetical protein
MKLILHSHKKEYQDYGTKIYMGGWVGKDNKSHKIRANHD